MGHKIFFHEAGFYGEGVDLVDTNCAPEYLRHILTEPETPETHASECVSWQVVCRGLPRKRARREFQRNLALCRRQNRRLWLLIQRKEAARG